MVCTISFSNPNFRVFRVNGKRLLFFDSVMIAFRVFFVAPLSPKVTTKQTDEMQERKPTLT